MAPSFVTSSRLRSITLSVAAAFAILVAAPRRGVSQDPTETATTVAEAATVAVPDKVDFEKHVLPILRERCFECHSGDADEGDLLLDDKKKVFDPERSEPILVAGAPDKSLLYQRVTLPADDSDVMPPEGKPLTKEQTLVLERWIREGAAWPDTAVVATKRRVEPELLVLEGLAPEAVAAAEAAALRIRSAGGTATKVATKSNAWYVNLGLLGARVDDAFVAEHLRGLESSLVWLNLGRSAVSDQGVAQLASFRELRRLQLHGTKISDAALLTLGSLPKLEYLNLYDTKVGDAGLRALQGAKQLSKLFVWQTAVSDAGVAALAAALPTLTIDRGASAKELAEVARRIEEAARPVNDICPVTGKKVDPTKTFAYEGKTVALCCSDCLKKFAKDPKTWFPKVVFRDASAAPAAAAPALLNAKCPVSGSPIDPAQSIVIGDAAIAFCCAKCKAQFEAEVAKHPGAKARFGK